MDGVLPGEGPSEDGDNPKLEDGQDTPQWQADPALLVAQKKVASLEALQSKMVVSKPYEGNREAKVHVQQLQARLEEAQVLADQNLTQAQEVYKRQYDCST
ncbi:UNVERIFIED_CONTAM: hypothetical protein K2H54_041878 [Gekko kuhli]